MKRPLFLLTGLLLVVSSVAAQAKRPAVTPAAAIEMSGRADAPLVLDVRTPAEFAAGHVPGAVLIPHDQLASRLSEIDGDRHVLVYCRSGARAGQAEQVLADGGFEVRQIQGSWLRWQSEQQPVQSPLEAQR